ncbi:MAG TPA: hypothetical protein VFW83_00345 [Bryobacteraceae bacterium]|nr:hypothetical protein [Bryobacteraceae bacterium]
MFKLTPFSIRALATGALFCVAMIAPPVFAQQTPAAPAATSGASGGRSGRGRGRGFAGRRGDPNWPPKGPAPRAADGHPDLSGAWSPNAFAENVDLPRALSREKVQIPFQPWAEKLYQDHKTNISKDDPEARCLPPGVPRLSTTPYPFRIMQTPKLTLIVYEGGAHVWRQIFTDGRKHSDDPNPSWLGESIGHWEGDTLVVDTIGFNGKTWLDESGLPTTESLHVIERFSRPDLGHLEIQNTIDDPKAYTKPWSFTTHPAMLKGELMEYICQENNRDLQHLVGK